MSSAALMRVIESAEAVVLTAPDVSVADAALTDAVFRSIAPSAGTQAEEQVGAKGDAGFRDLPVGAFFDDAIGRALEVPGPTARLAAAVGDVAEHLHWARRPPGQADPDGFFGGHANAILVGPNDLERERDVTLGVTLMAPNIRYPDHRHPPEEFYVVLSPGQWRQGNGAWREPGPGGVVVHAPEVIHSMRSGEAPLLALWFLRMPATATTM